MWEGGGGVGLVAFPDKMVALLLVRKMPISFLTGLASRMHIMFELIESESPLLISRNVSEFES